MSEFHFQVADESLDFLDVKIDDPIPTGRQILEAGGFRPAEEHLVFEVLTSSLLEERRLEETTDLRKPCDKKFIVFKSDRSFRFLLNRLRFEWGSEKVTENILKKLAGVPLEKTGVWIELTDQPDRLLDENEIVMLSGEGTECFRTGLIFFVCIEESNYRWPRDTIKPEEIAELGGWAITEGVIEVDENQAERTLTPGEDVKLRPGLTFGKKLRFKRGLQ